jgi:hypothetical protein
MKGISVPVCAVILALCVASAAHAQLIPPGGSQFNPPLPPPPPPKIEAPVIPQMDAPISQSYAPASGPTFGDRINTCLDTAAASGLGPNERAAYSRACANQ